MNSLDINKLIILDEYSSTPKYLQIRNSIIYSLENGLLKKNDPLPSINELSYEFDISRDTVEKGYRALKAKKIIVSYPGKGYFVNDTEIKRKYRIFLLFNKLSVHKKIIYDSLVENLDADSVIDLFVYNNDFALFKKLILNKRADYSHYVIIPHFAQEDSNIEDLIKNIPKEKLIFLDKKLPFLQTCYSAVFENFEKDIYNALKDALSALSKYHTLKIIFPHDTYFPQEILKGFKYFCNQYAFNYSVVEDISTETINPQQVYISLMEDDLVTLVEKIISTNLIVGKDVGVISYNETPLKKLILDGITTISTDFKLMGAMLAGAIKSAKVEQIEVPFYLNLRPSL
jgi:DNA-binding transcriptional regulator YhcF (GntR family)